MCSQDAKKAFCVKTRQTEGIDIPHLRLKGVCVPKFLEADKTVANHAVNESNKRGEHLDLEAGHDERCRLTVQLDELEDEDKQRTRAYRGRRYSKEVGQNSESEMRKIELHDRLRKIMFSLPWLLSALQQVYLNVWQGLHNGGNLGGKNGTRLSLVWL